MYQHHSKHTLQSTACPGLDYEIRVPSFGRRSALRSRLKDIARQVDEIIAKAQSDEPSNVAGISVREATMELIAASARAHLDEMLICIRGLSIDGRPVFYDVNASPGSQAAGAVAINLAELFESGPEALISEISAAITSALNPPSEEQEKNSLSPSGSSMVPEGVSSATNASEPSSGEPVTAGSTIPTL